MGITSDADKQRVRQAIDDKDVLKQAASNWQQHFQILGEFISQIKQAFNTQHPVGEFLTEDIYDSTATFAARNASSALLGILWPSSARKAVAIIPPDDMENVTDEEKNWYENIATKRLVRSMDKPEASLALTLDEYMLDQVIFGTAGIGIFFEDDDLLFKPFGVREMLIDEGKNGRVNKTNFQFEWDVTRVIATYGIDNVSEQVREKFKNNKNTDKIKVLIVYGERKKVIAGIEGNKNMPIESLHIEVDTLHILRDSGFEQFPVQVGRLRKLTYEKYGRSPGMDALPDIRELNVLKEAVIIATEKILDPPLGVLNDGVLGGGVIDTSAGSLSVFDVQSNVGNTPPVFPINTVGDLNAAFARIEALEQSIAQHFFLDRLLDFNNKVVMTATETRERSSIRNAGLASLITRQITEVFKPLVERSFTLLLRNDKLGVVQGTPEQLIAEALGEEVIIIPDRIAKRMLEGRDAFEVRFNTPADRITNSEELEGLVNLIGLNQQLSQSHPEARAYLNVEKIHENAVRLMGAPSDAINGPQEVEGIQDAEAQQIAQQQGLNQAQQVAQIAETATKNT